MFCVYGECSNRSWTNTSLANFMGFSATQVGRVLYIFPSLLRPTVIARLVLGAHQRVGPSATISGKVHIAVSPLDRLLNVGTFCFDSFEGPCLAFRIGKEAAQFSAVTTLTGKHARPAPVIWRHQRFGNPGAQVRKTGIIQPLNGRLAGQSVERTKSRIAGIRTVSKL